MSVSLREQIGAELADGRGVEREHGPVPLGRLPVTSPEHEPRRSGAPRLVPPLDAPASAHAEVGSNDDASLEAQHEVLPDRLDLLEASSVDGPRHARDLPARVRALGLDALADEHLQPAGDPVEGISLWHRLSCRAPRRARPGR